VQKRIFLSYRRDDSSGQSGRIRDRLVRDFGSAYLFMDVDGIPLGTDFVNRLNDEVAKCDVLLAVIGRQWIDLRDESGHRRLDNPNDFVRVEIGAALKRDIPLIPILLDGTRIPNDEMLPDDLKGLAARHGLDVRHATFHADLDRLVSELKRMFRRPPKKSVSTFLFSLMICTLGGLAASATFFAFMWLVPTVINYWFPGGHTGPIPDNLYRVFDAWTWFAAFETCASLSAIILFRKSKSKQTAAIGAFSFSIVAFCALYFDHAFTTIPLAQIAIAYIIAMSLLASLAFLRRVQSG
jgi:hypothetical protein